MSWQPVFVFGSNLAGAHGGGAAAFAARHCGAIWGVSVGLQGASYALPTMDENIQPLPLAEIAVHVADFLQFAVEHSDLSFFVTAIGCGIGGKSPADIAPMFAGAPENIALSAKLANVLQQSWPEFM